MTNLPLAGRVALVTGGAVRLGRAISLALASRGADIALHYHASEANAQSEAEEIRALGRRCLLVSADLQEPDAPAAVFRAVTAGLGKADILVNSAAVFERGTLVETTPELWERTMAVNLHAPLFLCKAFADQTDRGDIINISDGRAERPGKDFLAYTLTKAALLTLTRSLAKSLAPGIRVNAVAPGAILPPPGESEDYLDRLLPHIPLARTGTPEDIVRGVLYLLEAGFVTGEILHITGGEFS
jgi:NAD(P)-dependent dehydrogenase (short-subunit alcohol dehydrogenase family)